MQHKWDASNLYWVSVRLDQHWNTNIRKKKCLKYYQWNYRLSKEPTITHIQTEDEQNIKYKPMKQNYLDGRRKHEAWGRKKWGPTTPRF